VKWESGEKEGEGEVKKEGREEWSRGTDSRELAPFGPQPKALTLGRREGYVNSSVSLWSC